MNQKILYLECNSGISGDMTVGALLDLGADRKVLEESLASLPLSGYTIQITDVYKSGLRACDFNVILDHDNHDHDMEYLHGNGHAHEHAHEHHHEARNLHDILHILEHGHLTRGAFFLASRIFTILAEAEAHVHGKSIEEIHFHEVGAVDSIVDIAAAAICIDNLNPDLTVVSALTDGTGTIRCQHGLIPVPVPAVSAIVSTHGLPLRIRPIEGELVTPTGAAIAAALHTGAALPEEFRIVRTGLGAGKRDYAATGVLRAMLLETESSQREPMPGISVPTQTAEPPILKLETNIDDCTGEALAFTLDCLMESGAFDVYYTPIYMKKNRPAWMLTVLCSPEKQQEMESIIFRNTTTIGIRMTEMNRTRLERRIISLKTPWGPAEVKCCGFGNETWYYPENDSVARLAKQENKGFGDMYRMIQEYAAKQNASS